MLSCLAVGLMNASGPDERLRPGGGPDERLVHRSWHDDAPHRIWWGAVLGGQEKPADVREPLLLKALGRCQVTPVSVTVAVKPYLCTMVWCRWQSAAALSRSVRPPKTQCRTW